MSDVVFKKRSRAGARDVRKRGPDDTEAVAEQPETSSAVVTKKSRTDAACHDEDRPAHVDRFGESSIRAVERANTSALNANTNKDDAARSANDWDVQEEMASFQSNDDGKYRGMAGYAKYTQERDDGSSAKFKAKGPIKAPANVRTVTVVDYQPDVCKDYKETGYCGFGDTCKFLHDRSDYLAGWQLNSVGEAADARAGTFGVEESDEEEEEIPFACLICRQPFTDPVVTLCGHYFCAQCAIQRFAKTPKCFACGAKTKGLFNAATKILERMNQRQAAKAEARAERRRMHGLEEERDTAQDATPLLDGVVVDTDS
ncbi:spliceosomal zinc finger-containing protein [Malassezia pachydermatis]|uniref:Pre-mRNA-splicing factor CWC24 n=1 Tax=Malassezia pachydermatis TaxID=77020 RepID=A0A0M8MMV0_9BASI|nr:spliceosomal zinc finger-containing protein [Malassezia pachydermatis]KOS15676.1 spliceosomal zinc finger-containing protein [Malassezia pachydermatis]